MKKRVGTFVILISLFYAYVAESKTTTYPSSGSCNTTLQACIDAASSGDVILLAVTTIDEDLKITKSLVLQPAVGFSVLIGGAGVMRELDITPSGGKVNVTLNQLNLRQVIVFVDLEQGSGHQVTVSNSWITLGGIYVAMTVSADVNLLKNGFSTDLNSAVTFSTYSPNATDNMHMNMIGNWIIGSNFSGAIDLEMAGAGNVSADIKSNLLYYAEGCNCGAPAGILLNQVPGTTAHAVATIVNNTFDHIDAGPSVWVYQVATTASVTAFIYNNIMTMGSDRGLKFPPFAANLKIFHDYNDSYGNALADNYGGYPSGGHSISQDPLYLSSGIDYDLDAASPCRNAGTSSTGSSGIPLADLLDRPRMIDQRVDIGAYEIHQNASTEFLPFADFFIGPTLNPNYQYVTGTWLQDYTNLVGTPKGKATFLVGPSFPMCTVCTVEATMKSATGQHHGGKLWLLGWYQDKKNDVELVMNVAGHQWQLIQRVNGHKVRRAKVSMPIVPEREYRVSLRYDGFNLIARVDGQVILTVPAAVAPGGTEGFQVQSTVGYFNDLFLVE